MNERNVEALEKLIELAKDASHDDAPGWWESRALAEMLSSDGVLVPAAISDQQLVRMADLGDPDRFAPPDLRLQCASVIRYELEKLAKGEE